MAEQENEILSKLRQLNQTLALLRSQKQKLSRSPASKVKRWKTENEIPNQVEQIRKESIRLRLQLDSLKQRHFSELEFFETYVDAYHNQPKNSDLPELGIELELNSHFFGHQILVRPVWILKRDNVENWLVKPASNEAFLKLSGDMIPKDLIQAYQNKQPPKSFSLYSELVHFPLNTGEQNIQPTQAQLSSTQFYFTSNSSLILISPSALNRWSELSTDAHDFNATTSTHLAVQASLDLGCLESSHWKNKVADVYAPMISPHSPDHLENFEHVDPRSLKALSLLK